MKKISEMDNREIRELIETHTIIDDMTQDEFDRWDEYIGKRDYDYDNDRCYLIYELTKAKFAGTDSERANKIISLINDFDDAKALSGVLVDMGTYMEVDVELPQDSIIEEYDGMDGYIYAAQLEFAYNLLGDYAPDEELINCFKDDYYGIR